MRTLFASLGLIVFINAAALGQTATKKAAAPIRSVPVKRAAGATSNPPKPALPMPKSGAAASTSAKAAPPKNPKLEKFKKLTFDRRPSAILKAWSVPTLKEKKGEAKIDNELRMFQRNVTLGNWSAVTKFLKALPEADAKVAYKHLLDSLRKGPPADRTIPAQGRAHAEKNEFSTIDVLALADAAPHEIDKALTIVLGGILRRALDSGDLVEDLLVRLRAEVAQPDEEKILTKRQVVHLLFAAGLAIEAGEFLPDLLAAKEKDDREALNLLSRYFLARHAKEKKVIQLERAWEVTQAVLASGEVKEAEKVEALKRAVELAPKIRDEFGEAWLEESFTSRPERGMEIIATVGALASKGLQSKPTDSAFRLKGLQLQNTAVEALLTAAPELGTKWRESLNLLAGNWLREAQVSHKYDTSTSIGPSIRRDSYGNIFYMNYARNYSSRNSRQPLAIAIGELLEIQPGKTWLALIDDSVRPKYDIVFSQLYLKVNEETQAFPYIEQLANTHPDQAKKLAEEFLTVWTSNNNPNQSRSRTNPYMYMYGFERKAASIPLTRSKQQRNLAELAKWVKRLQALPIGELNEELLARAFTTCHSTAEVYRLEAIENVFGAIGKLKPATLAEMVQKMRNNLLSVWRQPAVQKDKQTNRKQKDIEAEVMRGYSVAKSVITGGLEKYPEDWALQVALAAILHDENNYKQEIAKSSEFTKRRKDVFAEFHRAAEFYASKVGDLSEDEETTKPYEYWYYASLGACDLGAIDAKKQPDLSQPKLIRVAILALPGEAAERHMAMFANSLFTRMSAVNPAVKFRYLRTGFEIVGDHKQAHEAKKVMDYYRDLVTEIKLETVIDGNDKVGQQPFGIFVNLRHTKEIERESGGFSRYLQNQNNQRYSYNYGRPTENYRDKFQEAAEEALDEHFEVLSVTFQAEDVHSRAAQEYGWRVTPYAYILMKARGPEVDTIPSLRLDLDFLDTSGYAIIPVETPLVPVDCSAERGDARPIQNLTITQTLDERQSDEGKLILEIKATGQGLVPDLSRLLDLAPKGFEILETNDEGISISRFDPEADETVVVSERHLMVTMRGKDGLTKLPDEFQFGSSLPDNVEMTYQRYVDADLKAVEQVISLEEKYGDVSYAWIWMTSGFAAAVVLVVVIVLVRRPDQSRQSRIARFAVPDTVTPFTVLGLLKQIDYNDGLDMTQKQELAQSINRLEQYYFIDSNGDEPELTDIAKKWIQRTSAQA